MLLLSTLALAERGPLVFSSDPPGAQIEDHMGNAWPDAGQPVLDLDQRLADYQGDTIDLYFKLPGYRSTLKQFHPITLGKATHQPGLVVLEPETWWGPVVARTQQYWYLIALGLLGAAAGAHRYTQHRRESKRLAARLDQIDQTRGHAPQGIGRWRIVERLGAGGMGNVYRAVPKETLEDEESVALKLMHEALSSQADFQERFRREVQVSKSLQHPNIARVEDFGEDSGNLYLALEFIDGETLEDRIRDRALTVEETLELVRPLADALDYAHQRKIVHRDLKPANVMITNKGRVVLMDFGLARAVDVSSFTPTGLALGTPSTMAPEQVFGAKPSPAMDQYALGVILYRMLSGRHPFQADQVEHMMFQHINQDPDPLTAHNSELTKAISDVVLRAMAKVPEERFASVAELLDNLERAAVGRPIDDSPERPSGSTTVVEVPPPQSQGGTEDTLV